MTGPIQISILANASQANRTLDQTTSRAQKLGGAFKKAALPAAAALAGLAKGAFSAAQAAAEDSAAQTKLAQALKTGAGATKAQVAQTEKWITAQGLALGVADDQLRPAIAKLATATGSVTKAQKLASLAMDISATTGKSLESVTAKLAKAQTTGGATALAAYGAKTKDAAGKTRDLDAVIGDLAKKYKGAAASAADTAAGKQQKLKVQMGELQEQIGAGLLPILSKLTAVGLKVVAYFAKHQGVAKALIIALAGLAAAVIAVNIAMALNPAVLIIAGLVALAAVLYLAYQRSASFRDVCQQVATFVKTQVLPALVSFAGFVKTQVVPALVQFATFVMTKVVPAVIQIAQKIGAALQPILVSVAAFVRGTLIPAIIQIAAKFREWWPTIQKVIVFVLQLYGKLLVFYATVAAKVIPILIRVAAFILSKVVPAVIGFIGVVVRIIAKLIDFGAKLGNAARDVANFARKIVGGATTAVNQVKDKFGDMVSFIAGIPGKIGGIFNGLWDGLAGGLKGALNSVLNLPLTIPVVDTHIPGVGKVGGQTLIPALAKGGIVSRPTLALIGEAGPEAVVPLNRYRGAGGPMTVNVTVNAPVGSSPPDIGRTIVAMVEAYTGPGGRVRAR